jgi:hypothetical protein
MSTMRRAIQTLVGAEHDVPDDGAEPVTAVFLEHPRKHTGHVERLVRVDGVDQDLVGVYLVSVLDLFLDVVREQHWDLEHVHRDEQEPLLHVAERDVLDEYRSREYVVVFARALRDRRVASERPPDDIWRGDVHPTKRGLHDPATRAALLNISGIENEKEKVEIDDSRQRDPILGRHV